ncbi:MAG: carcinine hydrolase/isopenicillin-N N-acyltransferase family protein, partial [Promethearchaeota archaeon]
SLSGYLNYSLNGLPFTFIISSVLEQPNLEKAIDFIKNIQHASAQNYLIGGLERIICLECSANKIQQFKSNKDARRICHTNHPLKNDDLIKPPLNPAGVITTYDRYDCLETRLQDSSKKITVDTIKNILSSHFGPICIHHTNQPNSIYTFSSVIYSLSKSPTLYITVGPPCLTEYEQIDF